MTIIAASSNAPRRASPAAPTAVAAPTPTAAPRAFPSRSFFSIDSSDFRARWIPFQATQAVQLVRAEAARHDPTTCEPLRVCFHPEQGFSCVCGAFVVATPHQLPHLHDLSAKLSMRAVLDLIRVRLSLKFDVANVVAFMGDETSGSLLPHDPWTYRYHATQNCLEAVHPEWGYLVFKGSVIRCEKPSALDVLLMALDRHRQRKQATHSLDLLLLAATTGAAK